MKNLTKSVNALVGLLTQTTSIFIVCCIFFFTLFISMPVFFNIGCGIRVLITAYYTIVHGTVIETCVLDPLVDIGVVCLVGLTWEKTFWIPWQWFPRFSLVRWFPKGWIAVIGSELAFFYTWAIKKKEKMNDYTPC